MLETRIDRAVEQVGPLASEEIAKALLEAIRSGDDVMLNVAKNELIARGRRGDDAAVQAIRSALAEAAPKLHAYLVGIIGEIATVGAVQSLLDILDGSTGQNTPVRYAALEAIGNIGRYREQNVPPEALSSPLESYFDTVAITDPDLLGAVARALSTVGTAEGVEKLLRFIEVRGDNWPKAVEQVQTALLQVRNPEAVAPLQTRLQQDTELRYTSARIAGESLAAMGDRHATEALLQWAAQVTGKAQIEQALAWLSEVRDQESLNLLLDAHERIRFHDPAMREGISALAEQIEKQSTPQRM